MSDVNPTDAEHLGSFDSCLGGIGQPLSLLLKNDPLVTQLRLFDVRLAPGVAADIGHVNTPAVVSSE